MTATNIEFFRC